MSADAAFVQEHLALSCSPTGPRRFHPPGSPEPPGGPDPSAGVGAGSTPPYRSERREAASPPSACSVDRSERNKRASCQLWFLEPCRLVLHPVGSGHLQSTQSSCVRLTLLSAERSRRYKCAFVRSPSLAEIAMAIRPEALQGSGSSGLIFLLV